MLSFLSALRLGFTELNSGAFVPLSDEQENIALQLVPLLVPPKPVKGKSKKVVRPSYGDAAEAFITFKPINVFCFFLSFLKEK